MPNENKSDAEKILEWCAHSMWDSYSDMTVVRSIDALREATRALKSMDGEHEDEYAERARGVLARMAAILKTTNGGKA